MQPHEAVSISATLPEQLKAQRELAGRTLLDLAAATGLSRLTVSAAEGKTDARLSTLAALFDELGFTLVPVPKKMAPEVVRFINNGARTLSLPAGASAPLGVGQRSYQAGAEDGHRGSE